MDHEIRIDLDWALTAHVKSRPNNDDLKYRINFTKRTFYVLCKTEDAASLVRTWVKERL